MKKFIHLFIIFLCPVISISAAEIGVDTDAVELEPAPITAQLSPADKSDIKSLSHFATSLFIEKNSASSKHLLAALAENPNSSQILAFILINFRNYKVPESQLKTLIAIAKANPRALPLNVAALTLADCVKPVHGDSIDLKRTLAEKCVAENDPDTFNELQFDLFQDIVKTLSTIYLQQKQYARGDQLFQRIFASEKLYQYDIFLQLGVIFYTQAARNADKSRRFLRLLPSHASRYQKSKKALLNQLHVRSKKTAEINKVIKHLTFLQKLGLFEEAKVLLLEQLADKPLEAVMQVAMAELFNKQGKYALAATIWDKMAKRNPSDKFFRLKVAENAFGAKLYKLAAENYRDVLRTSPENNNFLIVYMLIIAELQLGNPDVAWELLKILPLETRFVEIRAHVLSVLGKNKQAFETLSEIIPKANQNTDSKLYFFWLALAVKSESPQVQLNCLRVLKEKLNTTDAEAANLIGYTYADLNKNLPEAQKLISYALSQDANNPAYLDSMAWLLFRASKFKQAADYIQKAISKSGKYPDAVIADHAGDIFDALGDKKQALYYWKLALKIFSFDIDKNKIINKIKDIENK